MWDDKIFFNSRPTKSQGTVAWDVFSLFQSILARSNSELGHISIRCSTVSFWGGKALGLCDGPTSELPSIIINQNSDRSTCCAVVVLKWTTHCNPQSIKIWLEGNWKTLKIHKWIMRYNISSLLGVSATSPTMSSWFRISLYSLCSYYVFGAL
jgi:hypothetical protein